jgi:FMN reductase
LSAVLVSGSPSARSRSRVLLDRAREQLEAAGATTTLVDLAALPAEALLGRRPDDAVGAALQTAQTSRVFVASSPVYRATYSGLLKVFFDLLPVDALRGVAAIPIMTGGSPAHLLAVDHGLRPLFASLGASVVPTGVYGSDAQFAMGVDATLLERVDRAVDEALTLVRAAQPFAAPAS